MRFLLDTNVLSELRKGRRCNAGVARWFADLGEESIFISVLTIGEIRKGIESIRRRDVRAAASLDAWLLRLSTDHTDRLLPIDRSVADEWGRMNVPDPLPVVDGLIAATARVHGLTVATRNMEDMIRTGAVLFDPFSKGRR